MASLGVAENDAVAPRDRNVFDDGLTATLFGRGLTVTDTVPDALPPFLEHVTVIVALPSPVEIISPPETVATDVLPLDQLQVAPDMVLPLASLAVAVRLAVAPMDESVVDEGLTATL